MADFIVLYRISFYWITISYWSSSQQYLVFMCLALPEHSGAHIVCNLCNNYSNANSLACAAVFNITIIIAIIVWLCAMIFSFFTHAAVAANFFFCVSAISFLLAYYLIAVWSCVTRVQIRRCAFDCQSSPIKLYIFFLPHWLHSLDPFRSFSIQFFSLYFFISIEFFGWMRAAGKCCGRWNLNVCVLCLDAFKKYGYHEPFPIAYVTLEMNNAFDGHNN